MVPVGLNTISILNPYASSVTSKKLGSKCVSAGSACYVVKNVPFLR